MKGKILLVDDNIDMLLIGQRIFTRAGYDFLSARTGQEGLDKALLEKPDIVILDYMLPDLNGAQFIKMIGQDKLYHEIKDTPIVILTARSEFLEDIKSCYALGLRAFLNKPFGHRELVSVIENIIQLNRFQANNPTPIPQQTPAEPMASDATWLDEVQNAAQAIAALCRTLTNEDSSNLTLVQKMNLQAIYTSSKRLVALLSGQIVRSLKDVKENYFS
ncbi:MAG TPA: response regulator [bacterium]|nr:response regulator [bacterium]HNT64531.1 response regulator [bacterium]HOX84625.1 response regulator [bacterium]HPG45348.1 response regulator [bacterium]HPM96876.1 response regulator [bacterium]